jgi:hypothetical protein
MGPPARPITALFVGKATVGHLSGRAWDGLAKLVCGVYDHVPEMREKLRLQGPQIALNEIRQSALRSFYDEAHEEVVQFQTQMAGGIDAEGCVDCRPVLSNRVLDE